MELISQHTKKIMEECKERARDAGLQFADETLEYIVTNKDLLELSPKVMIPTLYDYWVHDVEVLKEQGKYKLSPHNPYETVINSRPAISFYNDNNPDWLNIMIFYHVLGHIDFFQNNELFRNTWNDDFVGVALADKRHIANLRTNHGRWVDYVIEFARSIDNLVGYFEKLHDYNNKPSLFPSKKLSYYFENFLQVIKKTPLSFYYNEIDRYNELLKQNKNVAESLFFSTVKEKYPEFQALYEKHGEDEDPKYDVLEYIMDNSPFLNKEKNQWMKAVISIVRNTSMYFQPQIRTKIINEGWASYWHDNLFCTDPRIKGHETSYAKINSGVTSLSRVGLNPYAIGLRLVQYVEDLANKGKMEREFQKLNNSELIENFDKKTGKGKETIFELRKNFSDFTLINTFVSQDFVDMHNLFVVGQRYDEQRDVIQYYIKSKKAEDYKQMLINTLYHPPRVFIDKERTDEKRLFIKHTFESKQLIQDFIPDVLLGIEFLWGGEVNLETTEIHVKKISNQEVFENYKVLYTAKDRKVMKQNV
ncbi:MAG: SpoVR family protein [Bacteroidetes bacterium GWA2_30_7]|nr:MAG: SpoVR family protein [Bacteroidetes bacterium GWA2_30_7]